MKPWTFAHVADMQPGSPRSFRYNPSWPRNWRQAKRQLLALNPEFLLVGGDLTRDGLHHDFEFEEMKRELDDLPFPKWIIPGNMDVGNKFTPVNSGRPRQAPDLELNVRSEPLRRFASFFGDPWWSFEHKGVRFSGFADLVVNSGLPEEAVFWRWAEEQARRPRPRHHVWTMHYPLFLEAPDEPARDLRDPDNWRKWYFCVDPPGRDRLMDLFRATGATVVLSGHIHLRHSAVVEGIRFERAPSTAFGQCPDQWAGGDMTLGFLRFDVDDRGIRSAFVPLEKTWQLKGYGPGGHPPAELRDYSLAWGKDDLDANPVPP